jgi:hypothetical protein
VRAAIQPLAVAAFIALGTIPCRADDAPPAIACKFTLGASWSYNAGAYVNTPPEPLAFDVENIDVEAQSATLIIGGKPAAKPLRVIRALNANHYLEVAQEGFLNLTTIYDLDPATGTRPAIHSRHLGLLGQPIFAQYAGFCTKK